MATTKITPINKNDIVILTLKKKIADKKKVVNKRFTPITNCSLTMNGQRYNIHALDKGTLTELLVKLNALRLSAEDLGIVDTYLFAGYSLTDWISDITNKLDYINVNIEKMNLKKMEDKLSELLSNEKRVELELDDMAKMLEDM